LLSLALSLALALSSSELKEDDMEKAEMDQPNNTFNELIIYATVNCLDESL
jgi:hypothetical protein